MNTKLIDWNYVTGFFDGEGNIQLKVPNKKSDRKGIAITIGQKNIEVLYALRDFLLNEGLERVYVYPKYDTRNYPTLKISNKWDAKDFLERIKGISFQQKEIENALNFIATLKRHTRPFTEKEKEFIISLYRKGKSLQQIAKTIKCGVPKVSSFLHSLPCYNELLREKWRSRGIEKSRITRQQRRQIIVLYKSGLTGKEVANIVGISYHRIRHLLRKQGVTRTSGESYKLKVFREKIEPIKEQLIEEYLKGNSVEKLAKKHNVSEHQIYVFLKSKGLLRPNWLKMVEKTKLRKNLKILV